MKFMVMAPLVVGLCVISCGHSVGKIDGLMEEGKYDEALLISDECLQEKPNDAMCLSYRAQVLERLGKTGDAAMTWLKIVAVSYTHLRAHET